MELAKVAISYATICRRMFDRQALQAAAAGGASSLAAAVHGSRARTARGWIPR
jgi:hypothetical protein